MICRRGGGRESGGSEAGRRADAFADWRIGGFAAGVAKPRNFRNKPQTVHCAHSQPVRNDACATYYARRKTHAQLNTSDN